MVLQERPLPVIALMMQEKIYHILNGDALKEQFPTPLEGDLIVARECLVDGSVEGNSVPELFETRARFIHENYEGFERKDYFDITVPEFQKVQNIPQGAHINLWFEDDLFCQVNLWFVLHLIHDHYKNQPIYLIRPSSACAYNFGAMNRDELMKSYHHKRQLKRSELNSFSQLWGLYQKNDSGEMLEIAESLNDHFPFLKEAIQAHQDRLPQKGKLGRPHQTLINIVNELKTNAFGPVFREFSKREAIYGFGDIQVKRMLDEIDPTLLNG